VIQATSEPEVNIKLNGARGALKPIRANLINYTVRKSAAPNEIELHLNSQQADGNLRLKRG